MHLKSTYLIISFFLSSFINSSEKLKYWCVLQKLLYLMFQINPTPLINTGGVSDEYRVD